MPRSSDDPWSAGSQSQWPTVCSERQRQCAPNDGHYVVRGGTARTGMALARLSGSVSQALRTHVRCATRAAWGQHVGVPASDVTHFTSHQNLIRSAQRRPAPEQARGAAPDAIIVPSVRSAHHLGTAIDLAAMTDSWLVVLASRSSKINDVWELILRKSLRRAVAQLRAFSCRVLEFGGQRGATGQPGPRERSQL
jgi:hypothetical protein